jgi:hypothetical protein
MDFYASFNAGPPPEASLKKTDGAIIAASVIDGQTVC